MSTINQDPNSNTEEMLECIHLLYIFFRGDYALIDNWMFSSNPYMNGSIPADLIRDGEGIAVLEFIQQKTGVWQ